MTAISVVRSLVNRSRLALLLMLLLTTSDKCAASQGTLGAPRFELVAMFKETPRVGSDVQLGARFIANADSAEARIRIILPLALRLVAGDTVATPKGDIALWTMTIRPESHGTHTIRGEATITYPGLQRDEGSWEMIVDLRPDTSIVTPWKPTRAEHIHASRRWRYAGEYMVPIDEAEWVTGLDILRDGAKPRVVSIGSGADSLAAVGAQVPVAFVVFLDKHGNVREARLRGGQRIDEHIVAAARIQLSRWKFQPARVRDRTVADWLGVTVQVPR